MDERPESKSEVESNCDSGLRTVTIHRSDKGYGLIVSGESPVLVQDVKDGGPAAQAGVKKGDSIIRVNDTLVSKVNHKNVVDIIKSAQCVKLTLQSGEADQMILASDSQKGHHQSGMKPGDLITAPFPVNTQLQNILDESKAKMLQKYLDRERKVRDNIMTELQKNPSKGLQNTMKIKLKSVERQISTIQEELKNAELQSNSSGSDSGHRPCHHRVKSSPDPLGMHSSPGSNRHSGCDSTGEGSNWPNRISTAISEDEPPPGTPPPPYLNNPQSTDEGVNHNYCTIPDEISTPSTQALDNWNNSILTMEDEDGDLAVDDHGPFRSLQKLLSDKYTAYLAVFTNYVISNCDASSLFFYLITALYKEGGAKEMKKWAYEIHSSFLLPGAPMRLPSIEECILYEIDETLQNEIDKEEIIRKVFWKARQRARDDLNEQLADFRSKRSAGLSSLFGPSDVALEESVQNKCKELQVVEDLLVPCLDSVSEDLKNQTEQMVVMASSLATILWKCFGVKSPHAQQLIDKCPLFVNKDRPLRSKLLKNSKKHVVRDHNFILVTYYSVIHCNHCGLIIWGIAPQGYQCGNCEMNIHKSCVKLVEETCVGQVHRHEKSKDTKFGSFLLRIMPDEKERNRKQSQVSASQIERARRGYEDGDVLGPYLDNEAGSGDKIGVGSGASKEPRKSDAGNGSSCLSNHQPNNGGSLDDDQHPDDHDHASGDQPSPLPSSDAPSSTSGVSNTIRFLQSAWASQVDML